MRSNQNTKVDYKFITTTALLLILVFLFFYFIITNKLKSDEESKQEEIFPPSTVQSITPTPNKQYLLENCELEALERKVKDQKSLDLETDSGLEDVRTSSEYKSIIDQVNRMKMDCETKSNSSNIPASERLGTTSSCNSSMITQYLSLLAKMESDYLNDLEKERDKIDSEYQGELNRCAIKYSE